MLLLAGVLLAGIGLSSFVSFLRADFNAYQPDSSISVTNLGFTLYSEDRAKGADDLRCTATGPDGQVRLQPVSGRTTMSNSRRVFVVIASTPDDLPAGRYVISCEGASGRPDFALYVGPRFDFSAVGRLVLFCIVAPLFLGLCSVVLFAILAFLRHRTRRITAAAVRDGQPV